MITAEQPYYNYRSYLRDTHGEELYSIPVDPGYGCPNRAADGSGGCSFCSESGARAQQTLSASSVAEQIDLAIDFARKRYGARAFMAYIQAFTGTFAPVCKQRMLYKEIIDKADFQSVHIGTRPDCLSDDTIEFLQELQENFDVKVELGIQTSSDASLKRINRGHIWNDSLQAVRRLHNAGIPVIAHVIIGLPGETMDDYIGTAEKLANLPLNGIKIHNLNIIKGTELADEFRENPFHLLNEHEYLDALIEFIRRTPSNVPIIRIQTDTPDEELLAPIWTLAKGQIIDALVQHMKWRGVWQGELAPEPEPSPYPIRLPEPIETDDGSITFWNDLYKEHYHTSVGARSEALEKYINPSKLSALLKKQDVRVLDVCFGLGYNSLYAASEAGGDHRLEITALEIDRNAVTAALSVHDNGYAGDILRSLIESGSFTEQNLTIKMIWGDARHTAPAIAEHFDIIFLDAFSTQRNSELWTVEFFRTLKDLMNDQAVLLTYCSSLPVISGLMEAGLHVGRTNDVGRIRGGTIASPSRAMIKMPIDDASIREMQTTTRGIPYHDPSGTATNSCILKAREEMLKRWKISR